jgi:chaperonin cofactor prefoldin
VSADWLVLGTGSMLKQHNVTIDKRTIGNIVTNSSKSKIITHVSSDDKLKVENDFLKRQLDDKDEIISLLKQKIELLNG